MSNKRKNAKAAPTLRTAVRFKYGPDIRPHTIDEFRRTRGLPRISGLHQTPGLIAERVRSFTQTVNDVVPTGTTVSVWPAIDMAVTLAHVAPEEFGPASGNAYTLARGANTAVARTLTRSDGRGFDIVVDGNLFISTQADSDEQVTNKSAQLAHLAAHEPQHIVQALAGLDVGALAEAALGDSPTVNDLLLPFAEAVNEYQCEMAANRITTSPCPHDAQSQSNDLGAFRASLSESIRLSDTDRYQACVTVLTAAKELVKGIAYVAAYRFYDGDDRSAPDPLPEQWDRYMAELWPDLLDMFAAIPAAGEPTDKAALARTLYGITERTLRWLGEIGVRYEVEVQGDEWLRSCWWSVAEPI